MSTLEKKIAQSIRLLQVSTKTMTEPVELSYSGGKDSDVCLQLCREAGINFRAIYKNTTIDRPGTISHVKRACAEILRPKRNFFDIVAQKGFPNRRERFCCQELKEYPVMQTSIHGIRREESSKRAKIYREPVICRVYHPTARVNVILPILNWTREDIATFVRDRGLVLHPWYYRDGTTLDLSRRVGCLGCPLSSRQGLDDFKTYPVLVRLWCNAAKRFFSSHQDGKKNCKFDGDVYAYFVSHVFASSYEDFLNRYKNSLFGRADCKDALQNYFNVKL